MNFFFKYKLMMALAAASLLAAYPLCAYPDGDDAVSMSEDPMGEFEMAPQDISNDLLIRKNKAEKELDKVRAMVDETDLRYVSFNEGDVVINDEAYEALDSIARIAEKYPRLNLLVAGHADRHEDKESNLKLSSQRAEAVRSYLIHKGSLDPEKVVAFGYGDSQLIGNSKAMTGRAMNRRVEFNFFVPKEADEKNSQNGKGH